MVHWGRPSGRNLLSLRCCSLLSNRFMASWFPWSFNFFMCHLIVLCFLWIVKLRTWNETIMILFTHLSNLWCELMRQCPKVQCHISILALLWFYIEEACFWWSISTPRKLANPFFGMCDIGLTFPAIWSLLVGFLSRASPKQLADSDWNYRQRKYGFDILDLSLISNSLCHTLSKAWHTSSMLLHSTFYFRRSLLYDGPIYELAGWYRAKFAINMQLLN